MDRELGNIHFDATDLLEEDSDQEFDRTSQSASADGPSKTLPA